MKPSTARSLATIGIIAIAAASCTMKNQEAPPLTGPSEFGTSVTISVSPDVLQGDGASQSVVTVVVRDSAGQPLPNQQLRAEIRVDDQVVDFGRLSAKSLVSNGDGRATVVYTAPPLSGAESQVQIAITPMSSSFGNQQPRTATIRLVPTGIVLPPSGWTPVFDFSPDEPMEGQSVRFAVDQSVTPPTIPIAQYSWNFGDGGTATGLDVNHTFRSPGTFFVQLSATDTAGRVSSSTQSVLVRQGLAPTAVFAVSPEKPQPNDDVRFNASGSTPAPGRTIVSYLWDFGDGSTGSGVQATHRYTLARTYNVTLTVTDDIGRKSVLTKPVEVAVPEAPDGGQP